MIQPRWWDEVRVKIKAVDGPNLENIEYLFIRQ
jgi:hypothetical protein